MKKNRFRFGRYSRRLSAWILVAAMFLSICPDIHAKNSDRTDDVGQPGEAVPDIVCLGEDSDMASKKGISLLNASGIILKSADGGDELEETDASDVTDESEDTEGTEEPDASEETGEPEEPDEPGETGEPEEPDEPGETGEPEEPDASEETGEPDEPDEPGETGEPEEPDGPDVTSGPAVTAAPVEKGNIIEEFDEASAFIGEVMNEQMQRYLDEDTSDEKQADVSVYSDKFGLRAGVTFDFSGFTDPDDPDSIDSRLELDGVGKLTENQISRWINDAISRYPNLCTLFASATYTYRADIDRRRFLNRLTVHTALETDDIRGATKQYKVKLAELESVCRRADSMSDVEKILYVHDRIIETADNITIEKNDLDEYYYYTPVSILLNYTGVHRAYACLFNHAMTDLGIDSVMLLGENTAWNAVRLDDLWYYIDLSEDDPIGTDIPISMVSHRYFLVQPSAFSDNHELGDGYKETYGSILNSLGKAYNNFFPKKKNINRGFGYLSGVWYYSDRKNVCTWDGESDKGTVFRDISAGKAEVCTAVDGNTLYYSTPGGLYRYVPDGEDECIDKVNVTAMVFRMGELDYRYEEIPTPAPTTGGAVTAAPTATGAAPTATGAAPTVTGAAPTATGAAPSVTPSASAVPPAPTVTGAAPTATPEITEEPSPQPTEIPPAETPPEETPPAETPVESPPFVETPSPPPEATVAPTKKPSATKKPSTAVKKPATPKLLYMESRGERRLKVKVGKVSGADGYEVCISCTRFKKKRVKRQKKRKFVYYKVKLNKMYRVKIRSFVYNSKKKRVYSKYSNVRRVWIWR